MARPDRAAIEKALLEAVFWASEQPATEIAEQFAVTRQTTSRFLRQLTVAGSIKGEGQARWRRYSTVSRLLFEASYSREGLSEDHVSREMAPHARDADSEARQILDYGLTEIVNNAIDHSQSERVDVQLQATAVSRKLSIRDYGVGVFQRIGKAIGADDDRLAILELSKGKFTTDASRHTGEGIFFSSRMFDRFRLTSGAIQATRTSREGEWDVADATPGITGSLVEMELLLPAPRSMVDVFAAYSSGPDDYRFARTQIPIQLARFADQTLMSRSAARRVLTRIERFDEVVFDFSGIPAIGQAFADEIFRVFANAYPDVRLIGTNMNGPVTMMVNRAIAGRQEMR